MNRFDISVIIPTYNREESLVKVLELYSHQTYPLHRLEVIVVDDGSSDNTEIRVRQLQNKMPYRLEYIKQRKSASASARNKGLGIARADIVLFTGDDILPKEDLIKRHLELHQLYPGVAILGFVEWSDSIGITEFMSYIAPDGFQFRYGNIKDVDNCGFRHFYTSNISLSKKWFAEDVFDEDFPSAALEDTELAYRLEKKGLRIILNKDAVGYHNHLITVESFCHRMKMVGLSSVILIRKHPELKPIFLPLNISFANIVFSGLKRLYFFKKINPKFYWWSQIVASYIEGVTEGLSKRRSRRSSKEAKEVGEV